MEVAYVPPWLGADVSPGGEGVSALVSRVYGNRQKCIYVSLYPFQRYVSVDCCGTLSHKSQRTMCKRLCQGLLNLYILFGKCEWVAERVFLLEL